MARDEHERENLLKEATALVERVQVQLANWPQKITAGFRRDGCFSVFFGADPVYHFNSRCELRRAYIAGHLIKAEQGRLVALERRRAAGRVELVRHVFDETDTKTLLSCAEEQLTALGVSLTTSCVQSVQQVPASADVVGRMLAWLESCPLPIKVAHRPHAR